MQQAPREREQRDATTDHQRDRNGLALHLPEISKRFTVQRADGSQIKS
jgi:hypothetical protein